MTELKADGLLRMDAPTPDTRHLLTPTRTD